MSPLFRTLISSTSIFYLFLLYVQYTVAQSDIALHCDKGYRVSSIKRLRTQYNLLGSLTVECEALTAPSTTECFPLPTSLTCDGSPEGCTGNTWLAGFSTFLVENATAASILDPLCCSSPSVTIDPSSCINDQLNNARKPFAHSLASDLIYRGLQCWHQYDSNHKLVDLLWRTEICAFITQDRATTQQDNCGECQCDCGIRQCADGKEPVRVTHKTRTAGCGCDCRCQYKCVELSVI